VGGTHLVDIDAVVHGPGIVRADHQVFQDHILRIAHFDHDAAFGTSPS
jgi:hypothetical protein